MLIVRRSGLYVHSKDSPDGTDGGLKGIHRLDVPSWEGMEVLSAPSVNFLGPGASCRTVGGQSASFGKGEEAISCFFKQFSKSDPSLSLI